jgi:hypothetical protein
VAKAARRAMALVKVKEQVMKSKCTESDNWPHWDGPESVVLYCKDHKGVTWCLLWLHDEEQYCVHNDIEYEKFKTEADALHNLLKKCSLNYDLYQREDE